MSNTTNEDIKSIKAVKSLYAAMFSLLRKHSFRKITVKGVCEEALVSRATFYAHFIDKYDLLKYWMTELWPDNFNLNDSYEQIEEVTNNHIHENMSVLENLVDEADSETFDILLDCILSAINLNLEKKDDQEIYLKNIVLSHFYAGGIVSYLLWQVKNKFPADVPLMNRYLYDMILGLQDWQAK